MMTLEERERRAYADGRVEEAALLREAIDPVDDRIEELEFEVRGLKDDVASLEAQVFEAEDEIVETKAQLAEALSGR